MSAEIWLPVVGWQGLYEVSSLGRVRSLDRIVTARCRHGGTISYPKKGRILKASPDGKGYPFVTLCGDGQSQERVHQLACRAFHGPAPTPEHEVAHGDGDKTNASEGNLRWATRADNHKDKALHGTDFAGERHPMARLNESQVLEIRAALGAPLRALADKYGVTKGNIFRIRAGLSWRHLLGEAA